MSTHREPWVTARRARTAYHRRHVGLQPSRLPYRDHRSGLSLDGDCESNAEEPGQRYGAGKVSEHGCAIIKNHTGSLVYAQSS
jgi:hypothetical protein